MAHLQLLQTVSTLQQEPEILWHFSLVFFENVREVKVARHQPAQARQAASAPGCSCRSDCAMSRLVRLQLASSIAKS